MERQVTNGHSFSHGEETRPLSVSGLTVTYRHLCDLKPLERNPRTHSKKQIRQIAASIEAFGFTNPVLIDESDRIIAGHGRIEAAKLLSLKEVPTILISGLTKAQKRALVVADNKLALNAGWDIEILSGELEYLTNLDIEFDATITGFETPEIDLVILSTSTSESDGEDLVPEVDRDAPAINQIGDLWELGEHRLLCGDSLDPITFKRLLDDEKAQMVFTDPPYNVSIDGNVCGSGTIKHREFAMASGEMTKPEFIAFLNRVSANLATFSVDGSIHFICMDWRHMGDLQDAAADVYDELKNVCVWNKSNAGMGSLYRSKHELVFVFKSGTAPHINNIELGRHGRNRTNVWDYPGVNSLHAGHNNLALHPTVKPTALVADAVRDCSNRGGIVLDAFAGSGTTIIAAEQTGRRGYGVELDPIYVDTAIRRWQDLTGETAVHAESGQTFEETAEQRSLPLPPPDTAKDRAHSPQQGEGQ